jgi:23S rRNA (pseudouridine1915-N3)-methyltransferase
MKINIISVGKFDDMGYQIAFENYLKRIKLFKVELKEINIKFSKNHEISKIKQQEQEAILQYCKPNSANILLDEAGKMLSSMQFSHYLQQQMMFISELNFIIGGAFGVSDYLKQKSSIIWSLSLLTLPHLLVRTLLCEQIFRAQTIIHNHPYHKI